MINELKQANKRFDLPSLIIAFGQICNAVSYLHAQRPPIVHRDLKPVNFLIKNGAYKLGDFGSAVIGHVDLKTPEARQAAEEVVQKTTTQMFRSPEMVDLFMAKRLTQSTDIWALGCCLYSLAFFQNCFEEGSNLAILSSNYKIPEDNPYGEGIAELIRRMLTVNYKERADISEVILCLSALYSDRSLPPRKLRERNTKSIPKTVETEKNPRIGTFRTDGQGIKIDTVEEPTSKAVEVRFIVFSFLVHVFIISLDSILPFLGQKTESQLCRF
jgi:serine/threonine protein kinase